MIRFARGSLRRISLSLLLLVAVAGCEHGDGPSMLDARIASFLPAATEILVALGAQNRLVARASFDRNPVLAELPMAGGVFDPSVERLLALDASLVVLWNGPALAAAAADLRRFEIDVIALDIATIEDFQSAIETLAHRVHAVARGDSLRNALRASLRTPAGGRGNRPDVLFLASRYPPIVAGRGSYQDELIRHAGARNVMNDLVGEWPQVTIEAILDRDPDVIIVLEHAAGGSARDELRDAPGWKVVPAVTRGAVMTVSAERFVHPGFGTPEAVAEVIEFLERSVRSRQGSAKL